ASRSARHGTDELYEGLPSDARTRTVGHLLSLAWAVGAAVLLVGVMVAYLLLNSAVGSLSAAELAVGPLSVALFGAVGIALARWRSHVVAGPVAIVVLIAVQGWAFHLVAGIEPSRDHVAWLAPWVPLSLTNGVPPELVIRPIGWHVLYLTGLLASVAVLAIGLRAVPPGLVTVLIVAVVVAATGGFFQLQMPSHQQRLAVAELLLHPQRSQVCEKRDAVTYCAYPAYVPWIDRWAKPIEGVFAQVPPSARPVGMVVRQTFGSNFEGYTDVPPDVLRRVLHLTPRFLPEDVSLQRGEEQARSEVGPALYAAARAVGIPTTRGEIRLTARDASHLNKTKLPHASRRRRRRFAQHKLRVGRRWSSCFTLGQARAAVALWLAAQSTPELKALAARLAVEFPYGPRIDRKNGTFDYEGPYSPFNGGPLSAGLDRVELSDAEFSYAASLLRRPVAEVGSAIRAHWDVFTDPSTKTSTLVRLLHLQPLPSFKQLMASLPKGLTAASSIFTRARGWLTGAIPCH
ncbi:MAG: hypothetical protein M3P18_01120, partial [Actinomycetota bacterium]|nr:hypothetical protein [Actinomycetota bacterium]